MKSTSDKKKYVYSIIRFTDAQRAMLTEAAKSFRQADAEGPDSEEYKFYADKEWMKILRKLKGRRK